MGGEIVVRPAADEDWAGLWPLWHAVVAAGETYPYDPETTSEAGRAMWFAPPPAYTWVAVAPNGGIVGTYQLKPNQLKLGDHVANAGFMVDPELRGQGVGRRLGEHCLNAARELGYRAMQFNAVVTTNTASLQLWRSLGFIIVGTVPRGFRHAVHGEVDMHIMHRFL
ncbi:GNAT family N-acetyltransferase [Frankia sp. CNm7]|uniref:GNAT family N-acetyltransferase n=1 Tax=Frankia nepalensis TaxID=1836974 RepID=A0A937RJ03_9ACTN|nr:GNAT family N-acetyltransferase [Frankia nepalensis]MBL7499197.1 GNAT family N-acetyltransferase [Frankia nepalensis]MBL7515839.1 GNAT family N-acetyltransferase [Frankia nepalensis]MBL7519212.1 GNAT family N-acetyltransferase [Frankia nepalensis]MBL7627248.1 GNAT family N-acetyltransferase [Frankia nepalensis]